MAGGVEAYRADVQRFLRDTRNLMEDQVPFAVSLGLNETAKKTNAKLKREMGLYIDQPTPWTKGATKVNKWSTKRDLRAQVGFKDAPTPKGTPAADYLQAPVFGGSRDAKAFGVWLRSNGFAPMGAYVVPGKDVPTNRYGNAPPTLYRRAQRELSKRAKFTKTGKLRKTKPPKFFLLKKGGKPWGIGESTQQGSRIAFIYVSKTHYRKSFDFYRITRRDSTGIFPGELRKAYRRAIRSAKPRYGR